MKGEGGQKSPKNGPHGLCTTPLHIDNVIFRYLYGLNNVICMYYLQSSCVNHPQPSSNVIAKIYKKYLTRTCALNVDHVLTSNV